MIGSILAQPIEEHADPFALEPIAPSPDGSLTITVPCRTVRTGKSSKSHPVTIASDWSVTTPHDLDLERIAVAMGGYLSCIDLVDREIPALRDLAQSRARRVLPRLVRNVAGRWSVRGPSVDCHCARFAYDSAAEAAEHSRDAEHSARSHQANPRRLEQLARAFEDAYGTSFYTPPRDVWNASGAVRERDGVAQLWDAGVHPKLVAQLHENLWPDGRSMPAWFYLGVTTRQPNLTWLAATLAAVPDEDVAVWACWTEAEIDRTHPEARAAWLTAGVPRKAIVGLVNGAYTPADVARLAATSRRTVPSAAITLAAWYRAGCHPSPEHIVMLDELDVSPWYEPSSGAIDWLVKRLGTGSGKPTRTEVGLMLAVCGTRQAALKILATGVRDPCVAALHTSGASRDHVDSNAGAAR